MPKLAQREKRPPAIAAAGTDNRLELPEDLTAADRAFRAAILRDIKAAGATSRRS